MPALIVVCHRPGLIRGGRSHPPVASYAPEDFTPEQFGELVAEPEIILVMGELVTEENISAVLASAPDKKARK